MIRNRTKRTNICSRSVLLTSVFSKAQGLMFSKKREDEGLVFVFRNPVRVDLHMMFVFFPIDVLFLDENKEVIDIKENFMPFTFHYSKKPSKYVIELPEKTIMRSRTEQGDMIEF